MSCGDKSNHVQTSIGWSPVRCVREPAGAWPWTRERILQFKGLMEGVPPNTERTTVKPWVGSASWQEVFVLGTHLINRERARCQRFAAAARREEGEYPNGSSTDEQRSSGGKDRQLSRPLSIYEMGSY